MTIRTEFQPCTDPGNEKEKIYDEQVYPLMNQVLQICDQHDIPYIASFFLGGTLFCTSANLTAASPEILHRALFALKPDEYMSMMTTDS